MERPKNVTAKIWNKLSDSEKKDFIRIYKMFYDELNILSKIHNSSKAHNLALDVIWYKGK